MFVEFTRVEWDAYLYFNASEAKTYISTDLVARVEVSELQRYLEGAGEYSGRAEWAHLDRRADFAGRAFSDIIFLSAGTGQPDRITVEGAVEDVLMRIEFRS